MPLRRARLPSRSVIPLLHLDVRDPRTPLRRIGLRHPAHVFIEERERVCVDQIVLLVSEIGPREVAGPRELDEIRRRRRLAEAASGFLDRRCNAQSLVPPWYITGMPRTPRCPLRE